MWKETHGGGSVAWWCRHRAGLAALGSVFVPAVALLPYTKHEFGHPQELLSSSVTGGSQPLNSLPVAFTPFRLLEFGSHHHSWISNVPWMSRDRQEPLLVGAEPGQCLPWPHHSGDRNRWMHRQEHTGKRWTRGWPSTLWVLWTHQPWSALRWFGFQSGSWVSKEEELQSCTERERSQHHRSSRCASPTLTVGAVVAPKGWLGQPVGY